MADKHLSLSDAQKQGRLADFVRQEETRLGNGADPKEFEAALSSIIKPRQSKDQTSRSASRDGSRGK
jgi:hypothetical protein